MITNPLLQLDTLPIFSEIKPEFIEPALDNILKNARILVNDILMNIEMPTWLNLVIPMEEICAGINQVWSPVNYLNSVMN